MTILHVKNDRSEEKSIFHMESPNESASWKVSTAVHVELTQWIAEVLQLLLGSRAILNRGGGWSSALLVF